MFLANENVSAPQPEILYTIQEVLSDPLIEAMLEIRVIDIFTAILSSTHHTKLSKMKKLYVYILP